MADNKPANTYAIKPQFRKKFMPVKVGGPAAAVWQRRSRCCRALTRCAARANVSCR